MGLLVYSSVVLFFVISAMIWLYRSGSSSRLTTIVPCPRCGGRMLSLRDTYHAYGYTCPSCDSNKDEFGNSF